MTNGEKPRRTVIEAVPAAPPSAESGLSSLVRALLPERSAEDRMANIVRVTFGTGTNQQEYALPVLTIAQNRRWKETFQGEVGSLLDRLAQQADGAAVLAFINSLTDQQVTCVKAYDVTGLLPDLEENATEQQLLAAFLGVTAAAYPFAEAAITALQESSDLQSALRVEFWRSMSSSPRNTAGAIDTSKAN